MFFTSHDWCVYNLCFSQHHCNEVPPSFSLSLQPNDLILHPVRQCWDASPFQLARKVLPAESRGGLWGLNEECWPHLQYIRQGGRQLMPVIARRWRSCRSLILDSSTLPARSSCWGSLRLVPAGTRKQPWTSYSSLWAVLPSLLFFHY